MGVHMVGWIAEALNSRHVSRLPFFTLIPLPSLLQWKSSRFPWTEVSSSVQLGTAMEKFQPWAQDPEHTELPQLACAAESVNIPQRKRRNMTEKIACFLICAVLGWFFVGQWVRLKNFRKPWISHLNLSIIVWWWSLTLVQARRDYLVALWG